MVDVIPELEEDSTDIVIEVPTPDGDETIIDEADTTIIVEAATDAPEESTDAVELDRLFSLTEK